MLSSDIRWHFKRNHIVVQWPGESGLDAIKKKVAEIQKTCAKRRCRKVLINANPSTVFPEYADLYELGVFFEKVWQRNIRVAMLVPAAENARYKFFETVAKNRGVLIETFADAERAREWLDTNVEIIKSS